MKIYNVSVYDCGTIETRSYTSYDRALLDYNDSYAFYAEHSRVEYMYDHDTYGKVVFRNGVVLQINEGELTD